MFNVGLTCKKKKVRVEYELQTTTQVNEQMQHKYIERKTMRMNT